MTRVSSLAANVKVRGEEEAAMPLAERPSRLLGWAFSLQLAYRNDDRASLQWLIFTGDYEPNDNVSR